MNGMWNVGDGAVAWNVTGAFPVSDEVVDPAGETLVFLVGRLAVGLLLLVVAPSSRASAGGTTAPPPLGIAGTTGIYSILPITHRSHGY